MTGTAVIHQDAILEPTKHEVLAAWLPTRRWFTDTPGTPISYRFVDPDGAVGLEVMLVPGTQDPESWWQVPLTYRDAPCDEAQPGFIATMDHSVLGRRWIYDGLYDPVFRRELVRTIVTGGRNAPNSTGIESPVRVVGSGSSTVVAVAPDDARVDDGGFTFADRDGSAWRLEVARRLEDGADDPATPRLTGSWTSRERDRSAVLARMVAPG